MQVGAATETELEDRKLRIEDAKNATFAAVEEGIVPGGGAVFLHLSELVSDFKNTLPSGEEQLGAEIVFKSLSVSRCSLSLPFCSCQRSASQVLQNKTKAETWMWMAAGRVDKWEIVITIVCL